jgi:3-hydroxyacyl-[acyl-carrier-protein] dehydratase
MIDIQRILSIVPHRYPFLLVDKVIRHADTELTAIKNVTYNEPFFEGHFPTRKVMPGVLIIEALAQACGLLAGLQVGDNLEQDTIYFLVGVDNARFRKPVVPGDQLVIEVAQTREVRGIMRFSCQATVDGEMAASADIMVSSNSA